MLASSSADWNSWSASAAYFSVKSVEPKNDSRGHSHLLGLEGKEARLRLPFFQAPELLPHGHSRSYGSSQSQEARRMFLPCWRGGRRLSASSSTKVRDAHSNRRSLASRIRRSVRSQLACAFAICDESLSRYAGSTF